MNLEQNEFKTITIGTRVSSEEQAKGFSLSVQLEQLTNYCQRHSLEIVQHYREDQSAKTLTVQSSRNS